MVKEVGWIPSEVVPSDHLVPISHLKDINDEFDQIIDQIIDQITDRLKRNDQEPKAVVGRIVYILSNLGNRLALSVNDLRLR